MAMKIEISSILTYSRPKTRLVLSVVGLFFSLIIISSVFQSFYDINSLLKENKSEDGFEYLQISKEIGISTSLGLTSSSFSSSEINTIKSQDFIDDVGPLFSNDFRVYGQFAGNSFDMFFTSVKNSFIDSDLSSFRWKKGDKIVPVILSNQFVTLLNHAVLPSQGRRPIPKIAIKQAVVDLDLTKGRELLKTKARVVGFSDRISSVLVPKSFLDFANQELSGKTDSRVSMLILKVIDSRSKSLLRFLSQNDYEISGELPLFDNAKSILEIVTVILFVFGSLLLILSIALNLSQLKLIVIENQDRLKMLILLGYSPKSIANSILRLVVIVLTIILLIVFCCVGFLFVWIYDFIEVYNLGSVKLNAITFIIPVFLVTMLIFMTNRSLKKYINYN
ncbi:MAG: hypothetical protein CMD18_03065 [Flavobacteriales bacterium]|nr:hypothetical protein [Flavobacteriales bacterium]